MGRHHSVDMKFRKRMLIIHAWVRYEDSVLKKRTTAASHKKALVLMILFRNRFSV